MYRHIWGFGSRPLGATREAPVPGIVNIHWDNAMLLVKHGPVEGPSLAGFDGTGTDVPRADIGSWSWVRWGSPKVTRHSQAGLSGPFGKGPNGKRSQLLLRYYL